MNVSTLADLIGAGPADPRVIDLVLPDIGGGKITPADFDEIEQRPDAAGLRVSGLDQQTFETLLQRYGQQFSAIHFWKCPRVEDLSALEALSELTHVAYYWNQRASKLWDLSKTPKLRGLQFQDFSRLRRLDHLTEASALEELVFGDKIWSKNPIESLAPLASLRALRRLSLAPRKIDDARVQPLAELRQLEHLECPTNLFTTEQLAWLRARLPQGVQSRVLHAVERLDSPLDGGEGRPPKDVLVMGKRKPFLNASADAARVNRYIKQFDDLVQQFLQDPDLEPKTP